ncbi:Non-specific lipid-transfer protein [Quillaja saponaria]|uniref:Non-specific lipid-transfer protein n=1 Tax=Quillaja saponaria TaxID=32244 RepID=A0AAD7LSE8_QUISA|nr:Non-specific lipid-transfer protein [Quillaja saponaria]
MSHLGGLLFIILFLSRSSAQTATSCTSVTPEISPCLSFVKGGGADANDPSSNCCNGVKDLSGKATTKSDRTAVCNCIKQALSSIGQYDPSRISQLPKACGISLNLPPIDRNTDCSKAMSYHKW